MDNSYNGWTNWDTWNANLCLTNDEFAYKVCLICNNEKELKRLFDGVFPEGIDDIDTDRVNWREIFEGIK